MSQSMEIKFTAIRESSNNKIAHNQNKNLTNNNSMSTTNNYCKGLSKFYFKEERSSSAGSIYNS